MMNRLSKRTFALVLVLSVMLLTGCATELQRRFQAHVNYLAGDELGGRGVGSEGIELAADYIAQNFAKIGLEPAGDEGTYFQSFPLTTHRTLTDQCRLAFSDDPAVRQVGRDHIPFNFSSNEEFSGPLTFCGYGIVTEDKQHDDFEHLEMDGKVALMFRGEPLSWGDRRGFPSWHASIRNKVYNAKDRGVIAVLIVNQKLPDGESDKLIEFQAKGAAEYGIPAFHISRAMAERALLLEGHELLDALQQRLDAGEYVSADWPKTTVNGFAGFKKVESTVRNVVGVLRADGSMADQCVIIGAHYDHLGLVKPMMRRFQKGKLVSSPTAPQIHNGADDNASGVAGLLEIASRFAKADQSVKRSMIFVAFTAEESGLHGSKYYVDHPAMEIESTVAMLNLDMIGRMPFWSNRIQIFGAESGDSFSGILSSYARDAGLTVMSTRETGNRSDHASFIRKEIPSMHFYTGGHADYHKPTDDAHKINPAGGAKVVALVYQVAHQLAIAEKRPRYQQVKQKKKDQPGDSDELPSYRVVMGIAPGYGDDGKEGMQVDGVSPEGPADMAGMKTGDRIIQIGGKKVANVYDYMAATRNNNPGDTVQVVILRRGKKVTLQVVLAPAR